MDEMTLHRKRRLKALIDRPPYNGSQAAFAVAVRLSEGRVAQLLSSSHSFGERSARGIAAELRLQDRYFEEGFGVTAQAASVPPALGFGTPAATQGTPGVSIPNAHVTFGYDDATDIMIPQYDTGGKMGSSGLVLKDQPGVIKHLTVSEEWAQKNVHRITNIKNLAVVTGFGDSMRPTFNPGDPLLVDTGVKVVDHDGVYFFRVEGEGYVKRLQRVPKQSILVISDNPAYRDWKISANDDFEVFGKVVKAWCGEDF